MHSYRPYARALILAVLLATTAAGAAHAQQADPILTLTETNKNGGTNRLDGRHNAAVADINSSIRIRIDTDRLRQDVLQGYQITDIPADVLTDLKTIDDAAQQGLDALPGVQAALTEFARDPGNAEAQNAYRQEIRKVAGLALDVLDQVAPPGSVWDDTLNARLERIPRPAITEQYRLVFEVAQERGEYLRARLDSLLNQRQVFVQLGAWIVTREGDRPIHLEGFDTLPRGQRFEVKRTSLAITAADQQQFAAFTQQAGQIGAVQPGDLLAGVKQALTPAVSSYLAQARSCGAQIVGSLKGLGADTTAAFSPRRDTVATAVNAAEGYVDFVRGLVDKYQGTRLASLASLEFLATLQADVRALRQRTRTLTQSLRPLESLPVRLSPTNTALEARIKTFIDAQTQCVPVLDAAEELVHLAGGARAAGELKAENFQFSDQVLKLEVGKLPEETHFSLLDTGVRADEDAVVVKLGSGRGEEAVKDLEFHRILLLRVLPHLQLAPGLIFSYRASTAEQDGAFQAAPSYSVLVKWLSRKHLGFSRLIQPGLGLNVATLDFDNDDAIEIGFGAVLSVLHDYVQVGYGFNVHENKGYFFFGVNLPVATITTSLSSSNTVP